MENNLSCQGCGVRAALPASTVCAECGRYLPPNYRTQHYILDGKIPVPAKSLMEWAQWFEDRAKGQVALTLVLERYCVSTTFLGTDLGMGEVTGAPPEWFETMIFDEGVVEHSQWRDYHPSLPYQERTATWELALEAHARAIDWLLTDYCPPAARN